MKHVYCIVCVVLLTALKTIDCLFRRVIETVASEGHCLYLCYYEFHIINVIKLWELRLY
jgi:hypothetical protein